MELSGQKMLPDQDEAPNGLHLWTFKRKANAASNGVTIREIQCPLHFICNCHVSLRTVEGVGYIQLERRGLHHIDSHVVANKEPNDEEYDEGPPELVYGSDDDDDLDSEDDQDSEDEGDGDNAFSADDGL